MGKRANGEGNNSKVTINGKKYYRVRITVGFDALTGKQKRKDFYGSTLKEAKDKAEKYKNNIVNVSNINTVGAYVHDWLWNIKRPSVALSTFEKWESIYRIHIKTNPYLNDMKLIDVNKKKLQLIINKMLQSNSIGRVKRINTLLSICFKYAVSVGDMENNPCEAIEFPKERKNKKVNYINLTQQKALIKAVEGDSMELPILIGLICGCRLGEIMALNVNDIDFNKHTIRINKSLKFVWTGEYDKENNRIYEYTITPVKTNAGIRNVPFSSLLEDKLKARINEISTLKKANKGLYEGNYLIADNVGHPVDLKKPNRHLHAALKRADIKEDIHFHSLRHIFISNCIYEDIPLRVIMSYVGHSDMKMVMQIYSEIDEERNYKEYNKLNNLYN